MRFGPLGEPTTHVVDPELGECTRIGGSPFWILLAPWGGFLVLSAALSALSAALSLHSSGSIRGTPNLGLAPFFGAFGLVCLGVAWAMRKSTMLIGRWGFRYTRPRRRVQANWNQTTRAREEGGGLSIRVRDPDGTWWAFRAWNGFRIGAGEMRDLVNDARDACLGKDLDRDAELDRAFELTKKPSLADRLLHRSRSD